jgi:hypothetical protein
MALIFCDGFDWYLTADIEKRWTTGIGQATISPTNARSPSGQGVYVSGSNNAPLSKSFGANYTTGCIGVAYRGAGANKSGIIVVLDGTTEQISVRTNSSSVLTVTRNGTVLATGSTVLSAGVWYYIELKFTIHNSAGVVELKLNGAA